MLKELFEAHFYRVFPKREDRVLMIEEKTAIGDFSLADPKACLGCRFVCNEEPEKKEQLKVYVKKVVNYISIENVFSFVRDNVGEICDYMLETNDTTILVEMTCSSTENVIGKRQKARRQLENTLCLLYANQMIKNHIENNAIRYVIFSWRETFPKGEIDHVEETMRGMTVLTDVVYSPDNESKFQFGFKLKEIRYPDTLAC